VFRSVLGCTAYQWVSSSRFSFFCCPFLTKSVRAGIGGSIFCRLRFRRRVLRSGLCRDLPFSHIFSLPPQDPTSYRDVSLPFPFNFSMFLRIGFPLLCLFDLFHCLTGPLSKSPFIFHPLSRMSGRSASPHIFSVFIWDGARLLAGHFAGQYVAPPPFVALPNSDFFLDLPPNFPIRPALYVSF